MVFWHRRSGKDLTAWNYTIGKAVLEKGVYFYFLPTYTQGKKVIWESIDAKTGKTFLDYIPKGIIDGKPNETEMKIQLKNGSLIQIIGADNIDRIVGTNPRGVVFSEYPLMKPHVWDYIRPILTVNKGWALFIGTPRGTNHAWQLLNIAKGNSKWYTEILTIDDTGVLEEDDMKNERESGMTEDMIDQEYYCKFIEGASQVFKAFESTIVPCRTTYLRGHSYKMGIDLAKFQDFTVITQFDLNTFIANKQDRFNQQDYVTQRAKIEASWFKYKNKWGHMDSTGVGEPIYDELVNAGINIDPYRFTEPSRRDLLNNLKLLLENNTISIPDDERLIAELKSFQYDITSSGRITMKVPEGMHDDMVFSLALAVWEIPSQPKPTEDSVTRLLNKKISDAVKVTSYE